MGIEAIITLSIVVLCMALLVTNRFEPDSVMVGGLTLLMLTGVLSAEQGLSGFGHPAVAAIAALFIVVSGLKETGAVSWVVRWLLGSPKSLLSAQLRVIGPVAFISALLNNTPVVAMFIPALQDWSRRFQLPLSKLMLPLSYAALVGGMCTLVGTSTNLILDGLLQTDGGKPGLGMFEPALIGIPLVFATAIFLVLGQRWLLPLRTALSEQLEDARSYSVEMVVTPNGPLVGQSITKAGLRNLPGLFLTEITRGELVLHAVGSDTILQGGDILLFAGQVDSVASLQRINGLQTSVADEDDERDQFGYRALVEAVLSNRCSLLGKTIKEGRFRAVYDAAVVAVARDGQRIDSKPGDVTLKVGDTLVLDCTEETFQRLRGLQDFLLVSSVDQYRPPQHKRAGLAAVIALSMIALVSLNIFTMLQASWLAAGAMIVTRCTTGRLARRNIDWQVLIVIAASIGVGQALEVSGAAAWVAEQILALVGNHPIGILSALFFTTALLTSVASNQAAAVVMFPIALSISNSLGFDLVPLVVTIMVAASAAFSTPIAFQTNLMVYGPGGYRFSDYIRAGVPLTLLVWLITVLLVPLIWPL